MIHSCTVIIGSESDSHVSHLQAALKSAGSEVFCFDTARFPHLHTISFSPSQSTGKLYCQSTYIEFSQVHSVFWRSVSAPRVNADNSLALNDSVSMLNTFLLHPGIHWVNSKKAIDEHKVKPRQLVQAQSLGANIPQTYIGNDVQLADHFLQHHPQAIMKPVHGGKYSENVTQQHRSIHHLQATLCQSPLALQEYIFGVNIRTYVIGNHVFSIEIQSSTLDFRTDENASIRAIRTPNAVACLAKRIMRGFGMQWTAIDWRREHSGRYVFLEANPSPMFLRFEDETGLPLTECLVALLRQPNSQDMSTLQNKTA